MPTRNLSTALLVIALAVSPAANAATDPLCRPLRAFAASIAPGQKHEIVFRTSWGSGFKDTPDENTFWAWRCEDPHYEPAQRVCAALMKYASIEFDNLNAMRAIECLSPKTHFADHTRFRHGEFELMYGTENRGANITITFEGDEKVGGGALRIVAEGY